MNKNASKKRLTLDAETIQQLTNPQIATAKGGGMCSTGAPTGLCPTQSQTCTHTTVDTE